MTVIKKTKSDRIKKTLSKMRKNKASDPGVGLGSLTKKEIALIKKLRKSSK